MCNLQASIVSQYQVDMQMILESPGPRFLFFAYFTFHSHFMQVSKSNKRLSNSALFKQRSSLNLEFLFHFHYEFSFISFCFIFFYLFNLPKKQFSIRIIMLKYVYFVWVKEVCLKRVKSNFRFFLSHLNIHSVYFVTFYLLLDSRRN